MVLGNHTQSDLEEIDLNQSSPGLPHLASVNNNSLPDDALPKPSLAEENKSEFWSGRDGSIMNSIKNSYIGKMFVVSEDDIKHDENKDDELSEPGDPESFADKFHKLCCCDRCDWTRDGSKAKKTFQGGNTNKNGLADPLHNSRQQATYEKWKHRSISESHKAAHGTIQGTVVVDHHSSPGQVEIVQQEDSREQIVHNHSQGEPSDKHGEDSKDDGIFWNFSLGGMDNVFSFLPSTKQEDEHEQEQTQEQVEPTTPSAPAASNDKLLANDTVNSIIIAAAVAASASTSNNTEKNGSSEELVDPFGELNSLNLVPGESVQRVNGVEDAVQDLPDDPILPVVGCTSIPEEADEDTDPHEHRKSISSLLHTMAYEPKLQKSPSSRGSTPHDSKSHDVKETDDYVAQREAKREQRVQQVKEKHQKKRNKSFSPRGVVAEVAKGISKIFGEKSNSSDQA